MRTPVVLVAGQGGTDAVAGALLRKPGTVVVEHRFDGQVVRRTLVVLRDGDLVIAEEALELAHGCLACTIRNDLLVLLRKLHRRSDVDRIVVHLAPWLEPEPICWAINHTPRARRARIFRRARRSRCGDRGGGGLRADGRLAGAGPGR